jgi:hypothetical protein
VTDGLVAAAHRSRRHTREEKGTIGTLVHFSFVSSLNRYKRPAIQAATLRDRAFHLKDCFSLTWLSFSGMASRNAESQGEKPERQLISLLVSPRETKTRKKRRRLTR